MSSFQIIGNKFKTLQSTDYSLKMIIINELLWLKPKSSEKTTMTSNHFLSKTLMSNSYIVVFRACTLNQTDWWPTHTIADALQYRMHILNDIACPFSLLYYWHQPHVTKERDFQIMLLTFTFIFILPLHSVIRVQRYEVWNWEKIGLLWKTLIPSYINMRSNQSYWASEHIVDTRLLSISMAIHHNDWKGLTTGRTVDS